MKDIFLALQNRIATMLPALVETDWFLRQYDQRGEHFEISAPAAYIEFRPMNPEDANNGAQLLDISFVIHMVDVSLYDDGRRITDAAINHAENVSLIFQALHNWEALLSDVPGNEALKGTPADKILINTIVRTQISPDHSFGNLFATTQEFSCSAWDYSAMKILTPVVANLQLNR